MLIHVAFLHNYPYLLVEVKRDVQWIRARYCFPSSPFERQIQIEDRQPGNDGWLDLSTIICRAGPRHCEQCSKALVVDGILMVDGYVCIYIKLYYITLYTITINHIQFVISFSSSRQAGTCLGGCFGSCLATSCCLGLTFRKQFWKKSQLKQWLLHIASCLYTVGKLAGSGTASSSINFNCFPSCQLSNSLTAAGELSPSFTMHSDLVAGPVWETAFTSCATRSSAWSTNSWFVWLFIYVYSPPYPCEVFHVFSFDPLQTADYHKTQPVMPSCCIANRAMMSAMV